MGEAHLDHVGDQPVGQFVPRIELPAITRFPPRSRMHFIDRYRHPARIGRGPACPVCRIAPFMRIGRVDHAGGGGPEFGAEGEGIGLQRLHRAARADHAILVGAPGLDIGQEHFPHADIGAAAHRVPACVPIVEIADHRDELGIGRPDREMDAFRAFVLDHMRAELVEQPEVRALGDQEIVERPQHRAERIGVRHPPFVPCRRAAILHRLARALDRALEQAARVDPRQRAQHLAIKRVRLRRLRPRQHRTGERAARPLVNPQQGERIGVGPVQQGL